LEEVIECQCEFGKKNMMVKMSDIEVILRKAKITVIVLNIETMNLITKATEEPKIYQSLCEISNEISIVVEKSMVNPEILEPEKNIEKKDGLIKAKEVGKKV